MVTNNQNTQTAIESRLKSPLSTNLDIDNTFEQIIGNLEEWVFQEGIFSFLLNPINRRWLFWDEFHNDWEDTGHYAGEVTFIWDGNKLLTPKTSTHRLNTTTDTHVKMIAISDSAQEYPVYANTLIGNERNSDIMIEDTEVKGLILQHAGGFNFFAIGNKDVILINGSTVPQEGILLHDGDQVTLGKTAFNFVTVTPKEETKDEITKEKPEQKKIKQKNTIKRQCGNCHAELYEGQKFCTDCGIKIDDEVSKKFCPNCGTEIKKSQKFCTKCGEKL